MIKKLLFINGFLLAVFCAHQASAQNQAPNEQRPASSSQSHSHEIKGTVTDTTGMPLPGVTIGVKGKPSVGTVTDPNGRFILQVPDNASIVVSMIGFIPQELVVGKLTSFNVLLKSSVNSLNETVVVAYGSQKKKEVVGSVTSINVADLKVPSSNLTTALAGRAAGLIAYQRSGEPGNDNADFFVRGVTTFGYKKDPLILIDGVELTTEDLARLRPDDIESFSIMKDATSTALYGARGANGVILITTKKGKQGPAKLSMMVENAFSSPTKKIQLADPIKYMKMENEAYLTRNPLNELPYPEEKIEQTGKGNPYYYPATDWQKELLRNYTTTQRAGINVSGGGTVARYYVSANYTRDNGIFKVDKRNNFNSNIKINRYSLRANVDIDLTKTTTLSVRTNGTFDDYKGPIPSGTTSGGALMYYNIMHSNPVRFPAYYPADADHQYVKHIMFGNDGETGNFMNPYALMVSGYRDESRSQMSAQVEIKQQLDFLIPGLYFRTMANANRLAKFNVSRAYMPFWYKAVSYNKLEDTYSLIQLNPNTGTEYLNYLPGDRDMTSSFYWESALNYGKTIGAHSISAMLINILRSTITPAGVSLQQSLPKRNSGLSGRLTYNYDSRYFAEFNFGYNGSERFYKTHRFGFFPSAGVAWAISNEKFFEPFRNKVDNMKLRATYGLVGNDAIGSDEDRFFYLSEVNPNNSNRGATFGRDNGYFRPGYSTSRYANTEITWEKSYQSNVALEVNLKNGVSFVGEYYTSRRKDILMTRTEYTTMGLAADSRANLGEASGRGVDLTLNYTKQFRRDLSVELMSNFTYATSRFEKYEEPDYLSKERYRSRVGYPITQQWGYIAERLFIDDKEALNAPRQNFGEYMGGDIKYTDVNGDGQITSADMVPIGYPTTPEIVYGFGFSARYKSFDLSAFFQGSARSSFWMDAVNTSPFNNQTQLLKAYADNHWSEDNRNIYALWPRLSPTLVTNNTQRNTWFMRDGAFLRLKQVELGYALPKQFQRKLRASSCRIYVNGTNLLLLSGFKLWDVEMGGNGLAYPIQKVINVGLRVGFN